jgi:hypothetical protein
MKASPKQGTNHRQSGPGTKVTSVSASQMRPASYSPAGNKTSGSSQGHSRGKQG